MPLVTIKQMIHHAVRHGYTLGSFEVADIDSIDAVLNAAEACRAPVLLDISQSAGSAKSGMLLAAAEHAACQGSVPVGLVSTGVSRESIAVDAIRDGSNGLSIDLSVFTPTEKGTRAISLVQLARSCGIPVEILIAQLGSVTKDSKALIDQVDADVLAFSLDTNAPELMTSLAESISSIRQGVAKPLAFHGASLLDARSIQIARDAGVTLMHFTTRLFATPDHDATRQAVLDRLQALGSSERAADVLAECARWEPIEHVIVFNVETDNGLDIETILARGRQVLREIPGVRYVYTGQAVQENASYRFCWLVRFVHPAVIDTYREHPDHKQYADEFFRPIAPTRMSIDFYVTTDRGESPSLRDAKVEAATSGSTHRLDGLTAF